MPVDHIASHVLSASGMCAHVRLSGLGGAHVLRGLHLSRSDLPPPAWGGQTARIKPCGARVCGSNSPGLIFPTANVTSIIDGQGTDADEVL